MKLITNLFTIAILTCILVGCKAKKVNDSHVQEELIDSIVAEPDSYETNDEADDDIQDYGLIKKVEDGIYPMYIVTIEFTEQNLTIDFNLNAEATGINASELEKAKGEYAKINYTSELENNLHDLFLNNKSVLGEDGLGKIDGSKTFYGKLSGANQETVSDLPGEIQITNTAGEMLRFPIYVNEQMVPANGKEVTAYYSVRGVNTITRIEVMD